MRYKSGYIIIVFIASLLAQSDSNRIIKDYYYFPTKELKKLDINFSFSLGELDLHANNRENAIDGTIEYSAEKVTPEIDFSVVGSNGRLDVEIKSNDPDEDNNFHINDKDDINLYFNSERRINKMEFKIPKNIPIDFALDFGLGDAYLDMTNLTISELNLECGLSDVKFIASSVNPIRCQTLRIESALGDFNAHGLGNLRARYVSIDVGLGSAMIDLTGQVVEDMDVDVDVGLGSLELVLPKDSNIRLNVNDTFLSSVDVRGLIRDDGDEWISREWQSGRATLTLEIDIGIGSIDIDLRD